MLRSILAASLLAVSFPTAAEALNYNRGLGSKNIKLGYFEASSLIFYLNLHAGG